MQSYISTFITIILTSSCLSLPSPATAELAASAREQAQTFLRSLYNQEKGFQQEYLYDAKQKLSLYLAAYGRIWVYTQGIALRQAARLEQPEAHKMAEWLRDNAIFVEFEGREYFGGWHFSQNTRMDSFKDPRLITGAHMWAMEGLAKYLASPIFKERPQEEQAAFTAFYARGLKDWLHAHQREDGFLGAGWTRDVLKRSQGSDEYYPNVERLGGGQVLEEEDTKIVKATNVVMEHNIDALAVLNYVIPRAAELSLEADKGDLIERRDRLQEALFTVLYDNENERFVTGLGADNLTPSPFSALDNAAWLMLAVNFSELSDEQKDKLAKSLRYTIREFVKSIEYKEDSYYGGHYFGNEFHDFYIQQSDLQEETYHTEATLSLIHALYEFCILQPQHPYTAEFQETAKQLWENCVRLVSNHGFPYATKEIKELTNTLQSSTAAIWYIDVYDYLQAHGLLDS